MQISQRFRQPWIDLMRRILLLALALPACGESRKAAIETLRQVANPPELPPDTIPEMLDYAADLQVDLSEMAKLPVGVLYRDVKLGDGPEVAAGDSVVIRYFGWLPNGGLVDTAAVGVRIGSGDILAGLDAALPGMKVGGIRKLVLSPGLAFGAEGGYGIPPASVLVYDVELRARFP